MASKSPMKVALKFAQMSIERTKLGSLNKEVFDLNKFLAEGPLRRDVSHQLDAIEFHRKHQIRKQNHKFTQLTVSQSETQFSLPEITRCNIE